MKPFNLEAAKAGAPVVRRDGLPVKFIAHVPTANRPTDRVIFLRDGNIFTCTESGRVAGSCESAGDLFMAPVKRIVWVNLFYGGGAYHYETKDLADEFGDSYPDRIGGCAWQVEIEE